MIVGDLMLLRDLGGDFSVATNGCLLDDGPDAAVSDPLDPFPGGGRYYLVRPAAPPCASGSYDALSSAQLAPRDVSLNSSPDACP